MRTLSFTVRVLLKVSAISQLVCKTHYNMTNYREEKLGSIKLIGLLYE